ncbi:hypothetical protein Ahy_B09g096705 isoform B [Arachis hypogaea]|uniref:Uncharacterized protein n=2 Tax=Arachis hypogaea TaxID=3818 RepID=A0A444XLX7_ARAHY|nr:hypothetical protein Ahy_B09g096705 isoform B [Arachis hypogaea]
MGAGLKKDLRVSRVGPGGSLNAFFFLLIGIFSQRFAMVRKKLIFSIRQFDLCYDLLFMDVDKILPSSSTLGWHSLQVKGEVQTRKGLWWIPRHPETRKGVVSDEMLWGVENKRRSGDSRIGQPFELLLNPRAGKRQPGQLKHLSSQWKRKQKRFP